jgi:flavin-binding protein dodecin
VQSGTRAACAGPKPPVGSLPAGVIQRRNIMAKKGSDGGVYRVIDVIGTSTVSWEDAAKNAVTTASKSLRDLRIAEVSKLDMKVEAGKVVAYRARVQLSFKYEG